MKQNYNLKSEKHSEEVFCFYAKKLLSEPKKLREFKEVREKDINEK